MYCWLAAYCVSTYRLRILINPGKRTEVHVHYMLICIMNVYCVCITMYYFIDRQDYIKQKCVKPWEIKIDIL